MQKLIRLWSGGLGLLLGAAGLLGISAACGSGAELRVVPQVDLNRYLGRWYEIAAIPAWFEKSCQGGTTATYSQLPNGNVQVVNACIETGGKQKEAKGEAWVADQTTHAKLKVSFIPRLRWNFLAGDYWVIDLGPDYEYAVVGSPSRRYGWILSRTPALSEETLQGIKQRLAQEGYDFAQFKMTDQKNFQAGAK